MTAHDAQLRAANLIGAFALAAVGAMHREIGQDLSPAATLASLSTFADGASIDDLARITGLSHSGAVRIVQRLVTDGLATATPSPTDGRAREIHLTDLGRRRARAILAARAQSLDGMLSPLSARDRELLADVLAKALAGTVHDRDDARHTCRLCEPDVCGHPTRCPVTQAATRQSLRPADDRNAKSYGVPP